MAGIRMGAVVMQKTQQRTVEIHLARFPIRPGDCGFNAVIEQMSGHAAQRLERFNV